MKQKDAKKQIPWKRIAQIALFVLPIAVGVLTLFSLPSAEIPFSEAVRRAHPFWFAWSFLLCVIGVAAEALRLWALGGKTVKYTFCVRSVLTGKFYDCITPYAVGGQPAQMVLLAKRIPPANATALPTVTYLLQTGTGILGATLLFLLNAPVLERAGGVVVAGARVGLLINSILPVIVLCIAFAPFLVEKITDVVLKLLGRWKWIKNAPVLREKAQNGIRRYKEALAWMGGNFKTVVLAIVCSIVAFVAYASLPYFVLVAFGMQPNAATYQDCITLYCVLTYAAACIPSPGGAGIAEAAFVGLFGGYLTQEVLLWAVIVWRVLIYYGFVVIGMTLQGSVFLKRAVPAPAQAPAPAEEPAEPEPKDETQ